MAEAVFRLFLADVKASLTFDLNWERLPCFLAGICVVAGCDVDVGCGFGWAAALVLALTWLTDIGAVSVEMERWPAVPR
jgi:hypothetical protein